MSVHSVPKTPGAPFSVSAEQWNQLLKTLQNRPPVGQPILDQGSQLWVTAQNQYKTAEGEEVDLSPGEGVRLAGPTQSNTSDDRGLVWPPDPEDTALVAAFRHEPIFRIVRANTTGSTVGIVMDGIRYGQCGRVLTLGHHWCQVRGNRNAAYATTDTTNRGDLRAANTGEFKIIAQWRPEAADAEDPRPAIVAVGMLGFIPELDSQIRINIWGPPTANHWGLLWELPGIEEDGPTTIDIPDTELAYDIEAADLLQAIIDASGGKVADTDFLLTGDMLGGFVLAARSTGRYTKRFIKLPTIRLGSLESVILGAYCSYDAIGFLAVGY